MSAGSPSLASAGFLRRLGQVPGVPLGRPAQLGQLVRRRVGFAPQVGDRAAGPGQPALFVGLGEAVFLQLGPPQRQLLVIFVGVPVLECEHLGLKGLRGDARRLGRLAGGLFGLLGPVDLAGGGGDRGDVAGGGGDPGVDLVELMPGVCTQVGT